MVAAGPLDQLAGYANAVAALPNTAFQDIFHAQVAGHLSQVRRAALVGEGRITDDDEQGTIVRQAGDNVFRHAVGEEFLFLVSRHILEGQNSDGRLVGQGRGGCW